MLPEEYKYSNDRSFSASGFIDSARRNSGRAASAIVRNLNEESKGSNAGEVEI